MFSVNNGKGLLNRALILMLSKLVVGGVCNENIHFLMFNLSLAARERALYMKLPVQLNILCTRKMCASEINVQY